MSLGYPTALGLFGLAAKPFHSLCFTVSVLGEDPSSYCSGVHISNVKKGFLLAFYYLVGDGWDEGIYPRLLVFILDY